MTVKFSGANRLLTREDFIDDAVKIGCEEAALRAVIEVESSGHGFDSRGRLKILFEPHVFYRCLPAAKRAVAVKQGLAYPSWRRNYPKDSYPRLLAAMKIDETAALKACSWGLPQILGENHIAAGYVAVQDMVAAFVESEDEQVEAMGRFISHAHLAAHLKNKNWASFARGYNGASYRKNAYDRKLATAYAKWSKKLGAPEPVAAIDPEREANRAIQCALTEVGYTPGKADGFIGTKTKQAIVGFKLDRSLNDETPAITDEFKQDLNEAVAADWRPPVTEKRATATVQDLRASGSKTVAAADKVSLLGWVKTFFGVSLGGGATAEKLGLLDTAQNVVDKGQQAKGVLSSVHDLLGPLVASPGFLALVAVLVVAGLAAVYGAYKIKQVRLADYQSGVHVGTGG